MTNGEGNNSIMIHGWLLNTTTKSSNIMILIYSNYKKRMDIIMKKRLISFMLLITVISCIGFNTDYFKNLLTLISQAAKEVIYEETESYDEETTDSAVDSLEQELQKLDVRNFFEDESETEI